MTSYVLAIDQGTTSTRAIVFRADTSIAAVAQREFPQYFPADGEVEHEPEDLWTTTVATCRVRACARPARTPTTSPAIGITNQRETTLCGTAPPASRSTAPSSGRTGAPPTCARG